MSPKKNKKKGKATKPAALDVSELEEGEIRDDEIASPIRAPASKTTAATASEPGKLPSKPSKPSPTELKQGWEFVEQAEVEEGEIVEDDEWIVDALTEATKTAAATVAGMWQRETPPPTSYLLLLCSLIMESVDDVTNANLCLLTFQRQQPRQPV